MGKVTTSSDIGLKIKELRQRTGLSQEKLAEMVGVSYQQVQKYEAGVTTLSVIKLQAIADALEVPVTEFFNPTSITQVRLSLEESELLQAFRRIKNHELKLCIVKLTKNTNRRMR
jgi:transcriptional regulator with XRE-family HTH domain